MARPTLTREAARKASLVHAREARDAARVILATDSDAAAQLAAAKTLEAAGCYVRRAIGKGLI